MNVICLGNGSILQRMVQEFIYISRQVGYIKLVWIVIRGIVNHPKSFMRKTGLDSMDPQ